MRMFPEITLAEEALVRKIEHLTDEEIIQIEAEVAPLPYSYASSIDVLRKRDPIDVGIDPDQMAFSRSVVMPYLIGPMLFSLVFPRKIHDIEYLWASAHCVEGFVEHDKVVESDLPAIYSLLERAVNTQGHNYHDELLSVAQVLVARFGTDDLSSGIPKSVPISWYLTSGIPPPKT